MTLRIVAKPVSPGEQGGLEVVESLMPLFDEYAVERGNWPLLAFKMAVKLKHIVVSESAPIRRRHWSDRSLLALWVEVQLLKLSNPRLSDARACTSLGKAKQWKDHSSETLRGALSRASKSVPVVAMGKVLDHYCVDPSVRKEALLIYATDFRSDENLFD